MNTLRGICTASYRIAVLSLLLLLAAGLANTNNTLYAILVTLVKLSRGVTT